MLDYEDEEFIYNVTFDDTQRTRPGTITSVDDTIKAITFEINDRVKEIENVDVDTYFQRIENLPNLKYKSPVGLFIGWLFVNYSAVRPHVDWLMENLPGTIDAITRLELVRYIEFWAPSF